MHLSSSDFFAASQVDKRHLDRDKQIIYIITVYLQYLADNSFKTLSCTACNGGLPHQFRFILESIKDFILCIIFYNLYKNISYVNM